MRADTPLMPLSRMNAGIHREERDAEEMANKCLDGVDVIEDDGDLRRRDAFHAIGAVAPHVLPAGSTIVYDGAAIRYNRVHLPAAPMTTLHVGALEPFDGLLFWYVSAFSSSITEHTKLQVEFWNGSAWVALAEVVDTTIRRVTDNSDDIWNRTLFQNGEIHWHRSQMTTWAAGHPTLVAAEATSRYWVRLRLLVFTDGEQPTAVDFDGTANRSTGTLEIPGFRAFLRGPARSVIPVQIGTSSKIVVGSDRLPPRGSEAGAQLGVILEPFNRAEELRLIGSRVLQADEGGASAGEVTCGGVYSASPGEAWPGGTWVEEDTPNVQGTAGVLTRNQRGDVQYDWTPDQFRGAVVYQDFALSSITNTAATLRGNGTLALNTKWQDLFPDDNHGWEGFRIVCITNGSGTGTPVGEEREIFRAPRTGNNVVLHWHSHFSVAPDAQNRFDIRRPHSRVKIRPFDTVDDFEAVTNTADTITPTGYASQFEPRFDLEEGKFVHFQVGRPLHWEHRAGAFWDATFDTTTRKILLTNGWSSPLEYDGRALRRLRALHDPDNARVQLWVGSLPDDVKNELRAHEIAGSKLRQTPPVGKFISTWFGHTIVAGLQGRPYDVAYSAPAPNNDIWPLLYQTQVRDPFNLPITGMKALRDRLVVFTPHSVHALFPPSDLGLLTLEPIAMGVGFITQRAVAHVGMDTLIGASSDGVYMLQGSDISPVLEEWEHLVEGGANRGQLHKASAAYSFQRNEFYIAFPGRGSEVNNLVGVFNTMKRRWWVWRAPWGGVADIAVQRLPDGTERLLFGMEDGTIATLRKAATDDGDTITGRARSPLHQVDSKKYRAEQLNVMAMEMSSSESLTVRHFLDTTKTVFAAPSHAVKLSAAGPMRLDVDETDAFRLAYERWVTFPFKLKEGAEFSAYAYEVEGTGQWRIRGADLALVMLPVEPGRR